MSKKIYVGKISSTTTSDQLAKHFSQVGQVVSAVIAQGINPEKHAGYGYVVMGSDKETEEAIKKLNNLELKGSRLKVIEANYFDQDRVPNYYYKRHR